MTSPVDNSLINLRAAEAKADHLVSGGEQENAILWAILSLTDAVNTSTQTAVIKAKELGMNGASQQRLISELGNVKWNAIPSPQFSRRKHSGHMGYRTGTDWWNKGQIIRYWVSTKYTQGNMINGSAINAAQAGNQQNNAIREDLENMLAVSQQNAQIGSSAVNAVIDQTNSSAQEIGSILQILKSVTMSALLKKAGS